MRQKLPVIEHVTALPGQALALRFADGWEVSVNLRDFIAGFDSLKPLSDPARFATPTVEEWGGGVTWDNEGPLSIAATTLYRLAAEQQGDAARQFDAWMVTNGLSSTQAAESLGMTRRSIISYRTGARPVPRYIALACKGWEAEKTAA